MRTIIWVIVAVLMVLAFAGDKVRSYFKADVADVARESGPRPAAAAPDSNLSTRADPNPPSDRAAAGKNPSSTGSYVPSPADAPELYDSPTKRLGF